MIALSMDRLARVAELGRKRNRVIMGISFCQVERTRQVGHEMEAIT